MKTLKTLTIVLFLFLGIGANAQDNFEWDVIIDSLDGDKSELYAKTKMFIAENWRSAQDVIQNDDKDGGVILLKGTIKEELFFTAWNHIWTYSYSIKFYMKDHKARIIIENFECISARCSTNEWPHMPVADIYPLEKGRRLTGLSEKQYYEVMGNLKNKIQLIIDSYAIALENPIVEENEDW